MANKEPKKKKGQQAATVTKPETTCGVKDKTRDVSNEMDELLECYNELVENKFNDGILSLEDIARLLWSLKSSDFVGRTNKELDYYSLAISTIVKSFSVDEQKTIFAEPMKRINSYLAGSYQKLNEDAKQSQLEVNVMKTFQSLCLKKKEMDEVVNHAKDALEAVDICNAQINALFRQLEIYLHKS